MFGPVDCPNHDLHGIVFPVFVFCIRLRLNLFKHLRITVRERSFTQHLKMMTPIVIIFKCRENKIGSIIYTREGDKT